MKKILIIKNKRIGDVLVASIVANNLKAIFTDSHIAFLCYDYAAPVLENNPNIDEIIITSNRQLKNLSNLFKLGQQIKQKKFNVVIDLYAKFQSQFICLRSGATTRLSFDKKSLPYAYTNKIEILKTKRSQYGKAIDDRLNFISFFDQNQQLNPYPKLFLTKKEEEKGKEIFKKNKLDTTKKTVMLGVLGSNPSKSLPLSYMAELINFINKNYEVNLLFNYVPNQKPDIDRLVGLIDNTENVFPEVIGINIREFIIIMNHADLLVANEGGAVHIAKALNKPTFTLYSPYVKKENWATFEDGVKNTSLHLEEINPEIFKSASKKNLKNNTENFYKEFRPNLFLPSLKEFLDANL